MGWPAAEGGSSGCNVLTAQSMTAGVLDSYRDSRSMRVAGSALPGGFADQTNTAASKLPGRCWRLVISEPNSMRNSSWHLTARLLAQSMPSRPAFLAALLASSGRAAQHLTVVGPDVTCKALGIDHSQLVLGGGEVVVPVGAQRHNVGSHNVPWPEARGYVNLVNLSCPYVLQPAAGKAGISGGKGSLYQTRGSLQYAATALQPAAARRSGVQRQQWQPRRPPMQRHVPCSLQQLSWQPDAASATCADGRQQHMQQKLQCLHCT